MKYTVVINQLAFQRHFPELDIVDAAIFDYISQFMLSKGIERLDDDLGRWYWVSYKKIADDMPMIGIKSSDAIYRRVKNLIKCGLLKQHPNNQSKQRSYFAQGDNFDLINFTPPDEKPDVRMKNRSTPGSKTEARTDEKPDDTNIKDTSINDTVSLTSSLQEEGEEEFTEERIREIVNKRISEARKSLEGKSVDDPKYKKATEIAMHLLRRIIEWDPTHQYARNAPGMVKSVEEIEKAMRIDGRSAKQLVFIINYIFTKSTEQAIFWSSNMQSGGTLRSKFDLLKNRIKEEVNAKSAKTNKQVIKQSKAAVDRLDFEE